MTSEEAFTGKRVRVSTSYRKPELRGQAGTITNKWGDPNYLALDVLLEDGTSQLFWHHELDESTESAMVLRERRASPIKSPGRRSCPPHGPLLVEGVEEGVYVTKCLACGLWGPEREDSIKAKLAFDQISQTAV